MTKEQEPAAIYHSDQGNWTINNLPAGKGDIPLFVGTDHSEEKLDMVEQEPVATLYQHTGTGRTRIVEQGAVTDCDASWVPVGSLYLHAAPSKPESTTWQPIETAPKDNKRPLYLAQFKDAKLRFVETGGRYEVVKGYEDRCWRSDIRFCWHSKETPTHWAYQDEPIPQVNRENNWKI